MVRKKRRNSMRFDEKNLKLCFTVALHISTENSKPKLYANMLMLELLICLTSLRQDS